MSDDSAPSQSAVTPSKVSPALSNSATMQLFLDNPASRPLPMVEHESPPCQSSGQSTLPESPTDTPQLFSSTPDETQTNSSSPSPRPSPDSPPHRPMESVIPSSNPGADASVDPSPAGPGSAGVHSGSPFSSFSTPEFCRALDPGRRSRSHSRSSMASTRKRT